MIVLGFILESVKLSQEDGFFWCIVWANMDDSRYQLDKDKVAYLNICQILWRNSLLGDTLKVWRM